MRNVQNSMKLSASFLHPTSGPQKLKLFCRVLLPSCISDMMFTTVRFFSEMASPYCSWRPTSQCETLSPVIKCHTSYEHTLAGKHSWTHMLVEITVIVLEKCDVRSPPDSTVTSANTFFLRMTPHALNPFAQCRKIRNRCLLGPPRIGQNDSLS